MAHISIRSLAFVREERCRADRKYAPNSHREVNDNFGENGRGDRGEDVARQNGAKTHRRYTEYVEL